MAPDEVGGAGPVEVVDVVLPCLDEAEARPWVLSRMPAWARADPAGPALVLFGGLLLLATPSYPWYALPLAALVSGGAPSGTAAHPRARGQLRW